MLRRPKQVDRPSEDARGRLAAAVRTSLAAESGPNEVRVVTQHPIRTCIGCRKRAAAAELLRVVARRTGEETTVISVIPDARRRLPGRGAWVHPDLECVALAERRRAFGRALRVTGEIDPSPIGEYLAGATPANARAEDRRR